MKNNKILFIFFALSVLIMSISFSSCKKERGMEVIVTVKLLQNNDTSKIVTGARVEMYQGDVNVIGYTNGYGQFSHTFDLPAQLNISVTKDDTLKGIGIVNIGSPGEVIHKSIFIF